MKGKVGIGEDVATPVTTEGLVSRIKTPADQ